MCYIMKKLFFRDGWQHISNPGLMQNKHIIKEWVQQQQQQQHILPKVIWQQHVTTPTLENALSHYMC